MCYISFTTLQVGCFNEDLCQTCLLKEGAEDVNGEGGIKRIWVNDSGVSRGQCGVLELQSQLTCK